MRSQPSTPTSNFIRNFGKDNRKGFRIIKTNHYINIPPQKCDDNEDLADAKMQGTLKFYNLQN